MGIKIDYSRDELINDVSFKRLRESYMRDEEKSPQERFAYVSEAFGSNPAHAQRLYDYASKHWLSFSTPILSFGRSKKGLPISCFEVYMQDTAEGLVNTLSEVNWLSMLGGGVGIHVDIRSADDKSVGVMPHLKIYDAACLAYRQGRTRRGSYAAFLDIDHPDIVQFLEMRKPTGDQNLRTLNLHHGVNVSDKFMRLIEKSMTDANADDSWELRDPNSNRVVEVVSARDLWQRLLEMRMQTGEPYIVFIDAANRALPHWLSDKGLQIHGSNLCTEIFLPTNEKR
ncbi:ribonucleotide reductase N-terminal alpha domain-containing protein, partial [uncultured Parasutterella sp.]